MAIREILIQRTDADACGFRDGIRGAGRRALTLENISVASTIASTSARERAWRGALRGVSGG
ncbi:hypothetical protein BN131_3023 [Cronobacter malonaticus 681]|nr:hypothetical protein BN131_3023 [Cronobacter malonaticus 681]